MNNEQQDLIDEIYNQVIQEYSHLADEYEGDELQDKIMDIVLDNLNTTEAG